MKENIAVIQEFLIRGEIRLARALDQYQILSVNAEGRADTLRNPMSERARVTITLTEKEIAELASICFPPKQKAE
jgi:hypothetical protein